MGQTHYLVYRIIRETTNAGAAHAVGFCLQVEHLANHPGFPEKMAVTVWRFGNDFLEFGDHSQGKGRF